MADYLKDLRKVVGHRPLLSVGAGIILEDERGWTLLQRRSDNGCWDHSGGSIELDERVEDAARRELEEETGLIAGELSLLGVFSGPENHFSYPNGDEVSYVGIIYVCRDWSGEPRCQAGEVEELRFFPPEALPEPINPPSRPAISAWLESRGFAPLSPKET